MNYKNANIIISGKTLPAITFSTDYIKALKPTGRVVKVEDCPEIMPKTPLNKIIRAGRQQ